MPSQPKTEPHDRDVVLMHDKTEDGAGTRVLRFRPGKVEAGELRNLREGSPILGGEVVKLSPRAESPLLWNVSVLLDPRQHAAEPTAQHSGPPRVSSAAYRDNWDAVFGHSDIGSGDSRVLN